jgi:hypothetical protein
VRDWGSPGFGIDDLDRNRIPEILASDLRLARHFGGFSPPRVFHYLHQDGVPVVVDVTTGFPKLIRFHATGTKRMIARLRPHDRDAPGLVSSYVADQYLLGHGRIGVRELDRLIAKRIVTKAFKRKLLGLLHRYGYR